MSALLQYSTAEVLELELPLFLVFLTTLAASASLPTRVLLPPGWMLTADHATVELLDTRLHWWFKVWVVCSVAEIIASGGLPVLWLFTGSPKTYFDFGIPSIHGLLNSVLLAIAITRLAMALRFRRRQDYIIPAWTLIWAMCLITRQVIIVFLLEAGIVYCYQRKLEAKQIFKGVGGTGLLIYVFGVIGDLRSGASSFLQLAQPTENFPTWLPSGFLWVYIYLTTPINNLLYTIRTSRPAYNPEFANTLSALLPSVLRTIIFRGDESLHAANGELVTSAFNVSTAYAGPYADFGWLGMLMFTVAASCMAGLYWRKHTLRDQLCYAVLCQCLLLSVFYNHFVYLPVISQLIWIYYFFRGTGGHISNEDGPLQDESVHQVT